jgi:hypothetical protein
MARSDNFKTKERDIREFEEETFFDINDSSCPFQSVLNEIKKEDYDIHFAAKDQGRLDTLIMKKWEVVPKDRMTGGNRNPLSRDQDHIEFKNHIVLERHKKYGEYEKKIQDREYNVRMTSAIREIKSYESGNVDIVNIDNPFKEQMSHQNFKYNY